MPVYARIAIAAVLIVVLCPVTAAPLNPPTNLLQNPSFEQAAAGNEEQARNWPQYQCGYNRTRERSYAPDIDGPWSCRLTGAGKDGEMGYGGTNTAVGDLPAQGTFAATNSIYIASYTQGSIYGLYVTMNYDDGSQKNASFTLTDAQIKDNLGKWKTYRQVFTSDPQKKLKTITFWCLVWKKGEQKFIGTVYFDALELRQVHAAAPGEAALPFAFASQAKTPPRLDGVMDDECWQHALDLPPFMLSGGVEAAVEQTRARLAYDDKHLYLFLECHESALDPVLQKRASFKADVTEHDGNVFRDDAVELFLQPDPAQGTYYHFAVNSLGTIYDARCAASGEQDKAWSSNAQTAGKTGDRSWTVELAIPLQPMNAAFAADACWRVNLCRTEKPSGESSCWSPTGGPFHTPARFGVVAFGPPTVSGGSVDTGGLRKGPNRLKLTVTNPAKEAANITVSASVSQGSGTGEVGRAAARIAPGETQTIAVDYEASSGEGALQYEVVQDNRLLLISPTYPLRSDNPFIAWVSVLSQASSHAIGDFAVAQGEPLVLPLVLLAGFEEEQFKDATVILEVPEFLRLVSPLGGPRRHPTPLTVDEEIVQGQSGRARRLVLKFGPRSITYAKAREQRQYVENPLLFRAEYVGQPQQTAYAIRYQVTLNGQERGSGSVALKLMPPLLRKSPRELAVCNWPCGGTYSGAFFSRLSEQEQLAVFESWTRTGFNIYAHSDSLAAQRRLKTARGLPGTLEALCGGATGIADYLRANPQYQDATRDGKPLPGSVSPAHLLEEGCPVRQMLKDYVGKQAIGQPVLSWDYEVPVAYPQSIGFGAHNLAAFRKFASIPADVNLTPELVVEKYRPQWIDFRCRQNADVVKLLQEAIKAANPACMFFVYSGYQSEHTRETYGINWEYCAPYLDQGWCGYGRPVEQTRDTLKALQGKPLVGGELVWLGYGNAYPMDTTETNLMRRLTDCSGGFMVYYDWFVDGRFYSAISRTAAVAADFEPFFRKGKRDDSLATVEAGGAGNVTVYALGDERLVCLFGGSNPSQFRLQLKGLPAGVVATDYWEKKPVALSPALVADVPANSVKVIHIRPATAAAPAAPAPMSPVDETISDLRPVLAWNHDGAADCRYRVEVSPDRAFPAKSTIAATDLAVNIHVVTDALEENGTYFWRVQAADVHTGKRSPWSDTARFTMGILAINVQSPTFSPNGDGIHDEVALQAELRSSAPWTVTVVDARGRTVRTISGEGSQLSAAWDGKDAAGKPATDGKYELRLQVRGKPVATSPIELNSRFGMANPELERWCFWRPVALEGGAFLQDHDVFAPGLPYSLKLTGATPEAKAYWSNYRSGTEIPITAGKTYTYSGLVKTDLGPDAKAFVRLHFFTKDDRWAQIPGLEAEWDGISAEATGKQDWTRMTVSCKAPDNAAKAVLFFSIEGKGTAWLGSAEFGEKAQ